MAQQPEVIDFHTHAFPDQVAARAVPALEHAGQVKAFLDGRIASLLDSMDNAGVAQSVLCSIATKPGQFDAILNWSADIRSDRIIPFLSVHPADPEALDRLSRVRAEGFKGIKLHPYYQEFLLDEERMWPYYERVCREGLIMVMHTGFDIGFPRDRIAEPARIARVIERLPDLKLITTHLGAWDEWNAVEELLIGRPLYMDISYSLDFMEPERARRMLSSHPPEYLLFGTDSPWADQRRALEQLKALGLGEERERAILMTNAVRLLGCA